MHQTPNYLVIPDSWQICTLAGPRSAALQPEAAVPSVIVVTLGSGGSDGRCAGLVDDCANDIVLGKEAPLPVPQLAHFQGVQPLEPHSGSSRTH